MQAMLVLMLMRAAVHGDHADGNADGFGGRHDEDDDDEGDDHGDVGGGGVDEDQKE